MDWYLDTPGYGRGSGQLCGGSGMVLCRRPWTCWSSTAWHPLEWSRTLCRIICGLFLSRLPEYDRSRQWLASREEIFAHLRTWGSCTGACGGTQFPSWFRRVMPWWGTALLPCRLRPARIASSSAPWMVGDGRPFHPIELPPACCLCGDPSWRTCGCGVGLCWCCPNRGMLSSLPLDGVQGPSAALGGSDWRWPFLFIGGRHRSCLGSRGFAGARGRQ